jgi:hypothetical protein
MSTWSLNNGKIWLTQTSWAIERETSVAYRYLAAYRRLFKPSNRKVTDTSWTKACGYSPTRNIGVPAASCILSTLMALFLLQEPRCLRLTAASRSAAVAVRTKSIVNDAQPGGANTTRTLSEPKVSEQRQQ